jgi:hypothetical protein
MALYDKRDPDQMKTIRQQAADIRSKPQQRKRA